MSTIRPIEEHDDHRIRAEWITNESPGACVNDSDISCWLDQAKANKNDEHILFEM